MTYGIGDKMWVDPTSTRVRDIPTEVDVPAGAALAERSFDGRRDPGAGWLLLGRFEIRRELGRGGSGMVWEAHDRRLNRPVAIKQIRGDRDVLLRAHREAEVVARLNHPFVAQLYELVIAEGSAFLISEFVDGITLRAAMELETMTDRRVAETGIAMCDALKYAHGAGVVHRDVKPENIVVSDSDSAFVAKLTDFGIAQRAGGESLTGTGDVVGTIAYMSPEQFEGQSVDASTDVFSLAVTLFEGFTGGHPTRREGLPGLLGHFRRGLPSLADRRGDLPKGIVGAVDGALRVDRITRLSAAALGESLKENIGSLDDLSGIENIETGDLPGGAFPRIPEWCWRPAGGLVVGFLAAFVAGGIDELATSSTVVGFAAGALTAFAPRLGWASCATLAALWAVLAGYAGLVLVSAPIVLLPAFLLWRFGTRWWLPVLAPALGAVGLAPLYLLGLGAVRRGAERAIYGTVGSVWAVFFLEASGVRRQDVRPSDSSSIGDWADSISRTFDRLVVPLTDVDTAVLVFGSGALALLLPFLVRGRSLALDSVGLVLWLIALPLVGTPVSVGGMLATGVFATIALGTAHASTGLIRTRRSRAAPAPAPRFDFRANGTEG